MKTQKDKIIEILKEGLSPIMKAFKIDEFCEILADRILSETRTLSDEDKEQLELDIHNSIQPHAITFDRGEIAVKMVMDDVLDYLSLAIPEQPAMSEDEIIEILRKYEELRNMDLGQDLDWKDGGNSDYISHKAKAIKAALSQTKKK